MKLNQGGFALLTVVFIIVIFTVLGTSLLGVVFQSLQHRTVATEEVQGKLLAEAGLTYFKKSIEQGVSNPSFDVDTRLMNFLETNFSSPQGENERFTEFVLPNGAGSFAIMYRVENTVSYMNGPIHTYSQPYSKKVKVSVIGIPSNAQGDRGPRLMRVRLEANVYINTVPSVFHYALSTPNEVRLFGGSNIIGNIRANQILTTTNYRTSVYSEETAVDIRNAHSGPTYNQPYIEGIIFVENDEENRPRISSLPSLSPEDPLPLSSNITSTSRSHLVSLFRPDENKKLIGEVSAPKEKPYFPGLEPPLVKKTQLNEPLFAHEGLEEFIYSQFASNGTSSSILLTKDSAPVSIERRPMPEKPISWLEGFQLIHTDPTQQQFSMFIETKQDNIRMSENATDSSSGFLPTARLTGDLLGSASGLTKLFIGPRAESSYSEDTNYKKNNASVEMGRTNSFSLGNSVDVDTPFAFKGSIFIKGDLDIVGDIAVEGCIFVDGNVVIREISNLSEQNLIILATGNITLSNRYIEETSEYLDELKLVKNNKYVPVDNWNTLSPFSAYLYSEKSIKVYSSKSFNWIYGGMSTGNDALIELNTLRESQDKGLASRFVIQFDRSIFEKPTPGLPNANRLYTNIYDLTYKNFTDKINIIEK